MRSYLRRRRRFAGAGRGPSLPVPALRLLAADLPNSGVFNGTSDVHTVSQNLDLSSMTLLFVATVTGATAGTCSAVSIYNDAASVYLEVQAASAGQFRGRVRPFGIGQASTFIDPTTPEPVNANAFGTKTLFIARATGSAIQSIVGAGAAKAMTRSGGTTATTKVTIGRGRASGFTAMTMHEVQILDVTDDASVQAVANDLAARHSVDAPVLTPFLDTTAISLGDSLTVATGTTAGLNGWNEVALAAVIGKAKFFNSVNTAIADTQMSPFGFESPADDAKLACVFSNVTANSAIYSGMSMVTVMYGVNDMRRDVPLGTPADATDQTFWGAMNIGFANIKSLAPTLPVLVCITPPYYYEDTPNALGLTLDDYRDAVRAKAAAIGATVCDFSTAWGPIADALTYFDDGTLHPNNAGNAVMGAIAAQVIAGGVAIPI